MLELGQRPLGVRISENSSPNSNQLLQCWRFHGLFPHFHATQDLIVCPKEASMLLSVLEVLCRTRLTSVLPHYQSSAKLRSENCGRSCSAGRHRLSFADI